MRSEQEKYCHSCGEAINIKAEICPKCGVRQPIIEAPRSATNTDERWLATLLLCVFLGGLGIHRFYTGNTITGIIQLLTLGGCGIWALIDLILIVTNSFTDGDGKVIHS